MPTPEERQKRSRKSVASYLTVLFAAAFCLLLLTYLIERRNSEVALDSLSDSHATVQQNMVQVREERDALSQTIDDLERQLTELTEANTQLESTLEAASESALRSDQLQVALEQLENIETLCQAGQYEDALANIENFEQTSAFALLQTQTQPIQPVVGDPIPSPWEQYQTLKALAEAEISP